MAFNEFLVEAQKHFPNLQVKYKDENLFMKTMGKILFFNKEFMESYTTTIGSTVYFPSREFLKSKPTGYLVILLHELTHINESNKIGRLLFTVKYLFPQILVLLFLPLLFVSLKLALLSLIFLLPFPAYFRMRTEKLGYITSMYVTHKLGKMYNYIPDIEQEKVNILKEFSGPAYYFMWTLPGLKKDFDICSSNILEEKHPYEDKIFDTIDNLLTKI